jgi:hypothetical protein
VDYAAVVVVACDNDGAVGKPSSVPQTPRPHSAFVHLQKQIGGVSVCLNPPFRSIDGCSTTQPTRCSRLTATKHNPVDALPLSDSQKAADLGTDLCKSEH